MVLYVASANPIQLYRKLFDEMILDLLYNIANTVWDNIFISYCSVYLKKEIIKD